MADGEATKTGPLVQWIARVHPTTTWTSSVCTGATYLGLAGLLEGLPATTHWLTCRRLAALDARPTEQRVVFEGKIITAAGVSSGIDMALHLAAALAGEEVAQAIQLAIEYDPQPSFDTGAASKASPELIRLAATLLTS